MNVGALQDAIALFAAERQWPQFHTPKNLSSALVVEAAELLEIFQWLTPEESQAVMSDPAQVEAVRDEVADVAIYLLQLARQLDIDLEQAIEAKMRKNAAKYPAPETPAS
jgi:NTP pyrophosphatase (non-canonical NTP hydrolase)